MDNGNLPKSKVQEQISLYLDNALDPDQKQEFQHQIQEDPALSKAVEKEKHFRSLIRNKLDRPKLEPDFVQFIKNNIH
ncbi:zf-HC2 domain-containing protein [Membranicola marinus]|uniref:Zf-HC2 domain-containing protein n=1 Tax=Membranihabitans marinus TaxID=1227546 RepID=A0A953HRG0_9BACT|nr:zf-HC2 domain-containing protein [Membranihabitans marinus]MBY5959899.1 zf-HC2 domain-containing protein [Membranihabitans marinus]